jgi:gamma-glutamyltranspeptidase/glutathione hydrolase
MSLMDKSEGSVVLAFCGALGVALLLAVAGAPRGAEHGHASAAEHGARSQAQTAEGQQHAVAAAAPEASDAALRVLEEGGNAADALVAASFVMAVVRPQSTGIGGGGFVIYHDAASGTQSAIDGRERAPQNARPNMYLDSRGNPTRESLDGARAAAVPGLVAMLWDLHQARGSKKVTWERLVQPAIDLAEKGFPVPPSLARAIEARREVIARYASSRSLFTPDGRALKTGDLFVQADLGRTLRAIATQGRDGFYAGKVAEDISFSNRSAGGEITTKDLADYAVRRPAVVRGTYRGHEVVSMPPPSSGGVHLIEMLNVLGTYDLEDLGWHRPDHLHVLAETMKRAYADRAEHMGDVPTVPVKLLTSADYAAQLRAGIVMAHATPAAQIRSGRPAGPERPHTTHISVIDAQGNAASSTQTINTSLGSGFVATGTGIVLNNEMDDFAAKPGTPNFYGLVQGEQNAIEPGKRPLSSMTPTIVLREGKPVLIVGSPGGSRIITSVLQVISNVIDFSMALDRAVAAPRVHHQWLPDELELEPGVPQATIDELGARGHIMRVLAHDGMGEIQAIQIKPSGTRVAASDPRGEGRPAAR